MNKKAAVIGLAIIMIVALLVGGGLIYKGKYLRKTATSEQASSDKVKKTTLSFTWVKKDLASLVGESETIVRGKIVEVKPSVEGPLPKIVIGNKAAEKEKAGWKGEPYVVVGDEKGAQEMTQKLRRDIYTDKVIKVDKYYKSSLSSDTITIREMGGRIGNRQDVVADLTPLKAGDEVILFVQKYEIKGFEGMYRIIGGPQGKYYIEQEQARNEYTKETKKLSDFEAEITALLNQ